MVCKTRLGLGGRVEGGRADCCLSCGGAVVGEAAGQPQVGGPGCLPNPSGVGGPQSVVSQEATRLCRACRGRSDRQAGGGGGGRNHGLLGLAVSVPHYLLPDTQGPTDSGRGGRRLSRGHDSKPGNCVGSRCGPMWGVSSRRGGRGLRGAPSTISALGDRVRRALSPAPNPRGRRAASPRAHGPTERVSRGAAGPLPEPGIPGHAPEPGEMMNPLQ